MLPYLCPAIYSCFFLAFLRSCQQERTMQLVAPWPFSGALSVIQFVSKRLCRFRVQLYSGTVRMLACLLACLLARLSSACGIAAYGVLSIVLGSINATCLEQLCGETTGWYFRTALMNVDSTTPDCQAELMKTRSHRLSGNLIPKSKPKASNAKRSDRLSVPARSVPNY